MKRISCYIAGLVAACCAWGLHGCTEESPALAGHETATLRLNIPQLEVSSRSAGTDAENAIHSLRVLIMTEDGEELIHNEKYEEGSTSLASGEIIIENIPLGRMQVYVIANEKSIGMDYGDLQTWQNAIVETTTGGKKVLFKDIGRTYFPKKGVPDFQDSEDGLPMSWADWVDVTFSADGAPQNVTVELKRMVAKINLTISHDYTKAIEINEIAFGKFFGDRLYLFQEGEQLALPSEEVVYEPRVYPNLNVKLPAKTATRTLSLYVYPSIADASSPSPYTLGFTATVGGVRKVYPSKALMVSENVVLRELLRNKVLNVEVLLTDTNVEFKFKVVDWTSETIDVPEFN